MKIDIVVTDVVNDLSYSRKSVNTHGHNTIYYMTLSTGKQERHMIILDLSKNTFFLLKIFIFTTKTISYSCIHACFGLLQGKDVLVDVAVINDRDPVPAGFTVVDYTHDTSKYQPDLQS